jgi:hypothetical protein
VNKHHHIFYFLFLFHEVELFDYICVLPHTYFFFFLLGAFGLDFCNEICC